MYSVGFWYTFVVCIIATNGIFASHGDVGNQQKFDQNESTNNSIKFGIIGGYTINIREAPYQAAIIVNGNLFCGAVIISEHLILTTASCLIHYDRATYQVRVGATYSNNDGIIYHIDHVRVHERYDSHTFGNDIALLRLSEALSFNYNVKSIYIASRDPRSGTRGSVTGWGYLRENGPTSNVLMEAQVPIVDHETCRRNYRRINFIVSGNELCAGDHKSACHGDVGGPLVVNGRLVGLVSWSKGCGEENYPTVYTNILNYRHWIQYTIERF